MKKLILLFIAVASVGCLYAQPMAQTQKPENGISNEPTINAETATLLVLVSGIKNDEGKLMVALFNNPKSFPDKDPYKGSVTEISANQELIKFENLPYGDYAIAVLHDMNGDGKLDKNGFGIPTEGYCFSNNVIDKFGPPSWMQASFVFAGRDEAKIVNMEYGIPKM